MCAAERPRVLVVDDEKIIRSLFQKALVGKEFDFSEACGGVEALEMIKQQEFDLVISDIRMPDIDGVDLLRAVRERWPLTEVIMMTGYASEEAAIEAVRLGAYDFLKKPFESIEKVVRVTENAIERQRLRKKNRDLVADLRRKVFELQVLYDIGEKLVDVSSFSQLASLILDSLDRLAPFDTAAIVFRGKEEVAGVVKSMHAVSAEEAGSIRKVIAEKLKEICNSTAPPESLDIQICTAGKGEAGPAASRNSNGGIFIPLNKSDNVVGFLWILGEGNTDIGPEEKSTLELLAHRLAQNIGRIFEERARQKTANQVLFSANKLLDAQNEELKKVNDELLLANKELEKANNEIKMAQAKLLQQEKMASIGMLAAGVAHEINNPIGYIHSNMGTLLKYVDKVSQMFRIYDEVASESAEGAGETRQAARAKIEEKKAELRIDHVIEDLAALARESAEGTIKVKKIVADLKNFSHADDDKMTGADINELIETTLNIVWNELKYKAEVIKNYGNLPRVQCYPMQLNQVFMNLLVNAAQAISEKGRIVITTKVEGDNIVISTADTGCGIPKENAAKIFDPFFTTKPVGKGTGLGLSVVYDIVQRHRGKIDVKSEVGAGTEFIVSLPISEAPDAKS
ncbi:MAG: response regulator [Candidatus Lindowbacteria bacterium]|nr:response regulator [Candidatus Lindowbacteria bacterium]